MLTAITVARLSFTHFIYLYLNSPTKTSTNFINNQADSLPYTLSDFFGGMVCLHVILLSNILEELSSGRQNQSSRRSLCVCVCTWCV